MRKQTILLEGNSTRILVAHYSSRPPWSARELLKTINELGHVGFYERIQAIDAEIHGDGVVDVSVAGRPVYLDAMIVRGLGYAMSIEQLLKRVGVLETIKIFKGPVINDPIRMILVREKWISLIHLYEAGLPVPRTIVTENPYTAMRALQKYGRAVFKPPIGSLGLGSILVNNPDIGYRLTKSLLAFKQPAYIQEYIEKPGYDIRVFVVGDIAIAAMKRVVSEGWKTNIARGAKGVKLSEREDPEAYELAIKATKVLGLDYSGVDIIVDTDGKHYVIEVNASPLWRGLKEATGVDPARYIVEHIVNIAKR